MPETTPAAQPGAPLIPGVTREQVREMVSAAIEEAWWAAGSPPASEAVMEVVWPLLERAQVTACDPARDPLVMPADEFAVVRKVAEAAGEQPWTPEEIAGFRERFEAAMARYAPLRVLPSDRWKARAEAAEAKLAEVRAVLLEGGQDDGTVRRRALAVIGSEKEGVRGGSYDVWGADFGVVGGKA